MSLEFHRQIIHNLIDSDGLLILGLLKVASLSLQTIHIHFSARVRPGKNTSEAFTVILRSEVTGIRFKCVVGGIIDSRDMTDAGH